MTLLPPVTNTKFDQRDYNNPIYGMKGEFSLSENVKVPYFICLMDLKRITKELKTHEEVSPSLDTSYSLAELFQRQIDIERVATEIVNGYLKLPNKIKFFNSLTIVLLPKDDSGKIVSSFENYPNNNPPIPDTKFGAFDNYFSKEQAGKDVAIFGGVQFVATQTENMARLRWDNNRVDAVAVDGQHRLRALKDWLSSKNNQLTEIEQPTRVPIIFLLLHEEAGFVSANSSSNVGIKGIAREIFTDLNKNARKVDEATEIILDDLSVESCCVRSLITLTTCTDSDNLLPLSLLRWQEANNRFDQSYYLNSLVNLSLLVKDLLELRPPENPMSIRDVKTYIKQANSMLGTGKPRQLKHKEVPLEAYYESNYLDDSEDKEAIKPFSGIPSHYLPSAVDGFKQHFAPWLLKILREFKPYKEIIEYSRSNNLISGVFGQYLSQPKGHHEQLGKDLASEFGENWKQELFDRHVDSIKKLKCIGDQDLGEQWAFKAIFQKAVVRFGKLLFVGLSQDDAHAFGTIDDYIEFLDKLYDANIFRVHAKLNGQTHELWTFIAVNFGNGNIKVSGASENKILAILILWYFGMRYIVLQREKALEDSAEGDCSPEAVLKHFSAKLSQSNWPKVNDSYNILLQEFINSARHIEAQQEDISEPRANKIAKKRLEAIFSIGLRTVVDY